MTNPQIKPIDLLAPRTRPYWDRVLLVASAVLVTVWLSTATFLAVAP